MVVAQCKIKQPVHAITEKNLMIFHSSLYPLSILSHAADELQFTISHMNALMPVIPAIIFIRFLFFISLYP